MWMGVFGYGICIQPAASRNEVYLSPMTFKSAAHSHLLSVPFHSSRQSEQLFDFFLAPLIEHAVE